MRLLSVLGLSSLVVLSSCPVAAEERIDVEDVGLDDLLELDLDDHLGDTQAVSRSTESVMTAPASMTTLDSEAIRRSGARSIPDVLRFVPGVQVHRNAPGNYVVALRGTAGLLGSNVVVTVNGVPVNSPLDRSVDWDLVPVHVSDIDRVEVVRGPVSTIYGPNAYTGVINIVTREAYGNSTGVAARAEGGADTALGPVAGASGRYMTNGSVGRLGVFALGEHDGTYVQGASGDVTSMTRGGALSHLRLSLGEQSYATFDLGGSRSRRSSLDHLVLESNPQTRSLVFGAARAGLVGTGALQSVEVWSRSALQLTDTNPDDYVGFSYADTRSNRAAIGGDIGLSLLPELSLRLGAQGDLDWIDAPYVNSAASDRLYTGYGFYGNFSWSPSQRLHFTLGGRGDDPTALAELQYSFRASAVYAETDWALRLAAGSAYRAPSYVELGGRFVDPASGLILLEGDPDLNPPRNESVEVGLVAEPVDDVTIAPTVFGSRLSEVVVEDFDPLVRRTFINDERARYLVGAELDASWQMEESVGVHGAVSNLHFIDVDETTTATVGVPDQNSTVVVSARLEGTAISERLGYGLGGVYSTERNFVVRAGIPPRIVDTSLPMRTQIFGMGEYMPANSVPVWISLRASAALPYDEVESPLPSAARTAAQAVLGVEYREE